MKNRTYICIIFLAVYALMVMPLLSGGFSACLANHTDINEERESSQTSIAGELKLTGCINITLQASTYLDHHITSQTQTNQAFSQSKIIGFPVNPFFFEGKNWKIQQEFPSLCKLKRKPFNDVLLGLLTVRLQL